MTRMEEFNRTRQIDALYDTIAEIVSDREAEWRQYAACRSEDTSLFFAGRGEHTTYQAAIAVCTGCPVAEECREHAVEREVRFGVWGGGSASRHAKKGVRVCRGCGEKFDYERNGSVYCGDECRRDARLQSQRNYYLSVAS